MYKRSIISNNPFEQDPKLIFRRFDSNANKLQDLLSKCSNLDEIVNEFINETSPISKILRSEFEKFSNDEYKKSFSDEFKRSVEMRRLSAANRKFTLTPVIAKYTEESKDSHHLAKLVDNDTIDHIFVDPISGVEGFHYQYYLYIPIPEFFTEEIDRSKWVFEHWQLVMESFYKFKNNNLLVELKPLYYMGRVYGWNGNWIAYSVTVRDTPDFWSLPIVDSFYNRVQPFLAVSQGEFVVLENDETKRSKDSIKSIMERIFNRVKSSGNVFLKDNKWLEITQNLNQTKKKFNNQADMLQALKDEGKSIEIAPELALALNFMSDKSLQKVGFKLASASLEDPKTIDSMDTPTEILSYMQDDLMKPTYRFSPNEIEKCKMPRKF